MIKNPIGIKLIKKLEGGEISLKKKILWILVSSLMVLSLIIASCGPKEGDEGEVAGEDVPKYGGTLTIPIAGAPATWNPGAVVGQGADPIGAIVLEQILGRNWEDGPAGNDKYSFVGGVPEWGAVGGNLAESWEIPGVGVWVLNIRQGVHWGLNPDFAASSLVGGREMTADDVAYSIEYMRDNPDSQSNFSEPALIKNTIVERTGPWQVTVRTPVNPTTGYLWIMGGGGVQYVWAREHLENYATSNEWYDTVGTGPFMIEDYVTDVAVKFIRNDNYWDINPCGPGEGDQLPYIESINQQIIPDRSTRFASFRTGKADIFFFFDSLSVEEYEQLLTTNPEVKSVQLIIDSMKITGRVDRPEDPYSNLKVRQAMMLAIDHPTIVKDFYDGKAELLDSPARKWYPTIYTPLEEYPPEVQEYYGYNLERAKQLMVEAGYPDGFKKELTMVNTTASEEAGAILKEYLADIGIDLELNPIEGGLFMNIFFSGNTDWILNSWPGGNGAFFVRYSMGYFRGPNAWNTAHVNNPEGSEPVIEQAFQEQAKYVMVDYAKADEITKAAYKYCVEQAFLITMPAPWGYRVWQPWLKNYYGVGDLKFWLRWAWIDQDLKKSMGY